MAIWRKVVVSGSDARLTSLGVGANITAPSTDGQISASGKLFATTAVPSTPLSTYNVVIKGANGEFAITGSDAITPSLNALTFGSNVLGRNTSTGANVTTFDGSVATTMVIDSASLAGNGLVANDGGNTIDVGAGTNIIVQADAILVDTASISDTAAGLVGSSTFGKIKAQIDTSTLAFNGSGEISASFLPGATLEDGNGIVNFSYNGSTGASVAVDVSGLSGVGIENNGSDQFRIAGSDNFTTDRLLKWNGTELANGIISDDGTDVVIGIGGGLTTIAGNLKVNGTASFTHADNLEISDDFILLNSGSSASSTDKFGIIGATSAAEGIGWVYNGDSRWTMVTGSDLSVGADSGTSVGAASLLVNSTDTSENNAFMAKEGNMMVSSDEVYVYF